MKQKQQELFYDKNSPPKKLDANYMEIHDFEEQLKYLTENNYYFPTWEEVKSYVDGTSCLPEHSIVLTADDGDATFFDLAIPIVEKYNVKITSFLITSWIDDQNKLKNYDSNKIIFESHSHDMHRAGTDGKGRILTLSYDEACKDVKTSQSFIGNATVFCYPFGHYNDACYKILKDSGYTLAFTTKYGRARPGDNCYALSRIRMSKGDSLKSFISIVKRSAVENCTSLLSVKKSFSLNYIIQHILNKDPTYNLHSFYISIIRNDIQIFHGCHNNYVLLPSICYVINFRLDIYYIIST